MSIVFLLTASIPLQLRKAKSSVWSSNCARLTSIWFNPNFVMKICDLWVKFLNRGFGSSRGTWNRVTTMSIFFILISNFWALRGILRGLLDILRLLFSHLNWAPRVFALPSFCALCLGDGGWCPTTGFVYLDDGISGQRDYVSLEPLVIFNVRI